MADHYETERYPGYCFSCGTSWPCGGRIDQDVNKWSILDHGQTSHWWLGREGTACGRDFTFDIHRASDTAPRCAHCLIAIAAGKS